MDAGQIRRLKPMLTQYLKKFGDCFARKDTRAHFPVYVEGQLSDLKAKSCEPIALAAGRSTAWSGRGAGGSSTSTI